jgi:hypothetical protein
MSRLRVGAADRFAIASLYSDWNLAVDAGDLAALRALCAPGVEVDDEGSGLGRTGDLQHYLDAAARWGGRQQRHWCHLRAWREGDACHAEAFAMLVVAWPTGSSALAWCGYSRDRLQRVGEGWRFAGRSFRTWGGEMLARFPRYAPLD